MDALRAARTICASNQVALSGQLFLFGYAEVAYQSFTDRGACCVEVVDPGAPQILDHGGCFIPSLRAALAWFEQLR